MCCPSMSEDKSLCCCSELSQGGEKNLEGGGLWKKQAHQLAVLTEGREVHILSPNTASPVGVCAAHTDFQ